jgi:predicted metal-dependent phosphoesterase TrpH
MYKINIHAHTIFSDGLNTPYHMAMEAKRLGFTALVITDHYYGVDFSEYSASADRYKLLRRACREARDVLPVIAGLEVSCADEEILVFGSAINQEILNTSRPTVEQLQVWKKEHDAAIILCHPCEQSNWDKLRPVLDGFERYNSGQDFFKDREFGALKGLPEWCNSDAHQTEGLARGYNIVDTKITNEADLIKYIKRGKQPKHVLNGDGK